MKALFAAFALSTTLVAPSFAQTVTAPAPIIVVDGGETTSTINVAGISGNITGLTVTLNLLSHTYPDDLVFGLLNEDTGLGFVFMSGVGGSTDVSNINVTFSDLASDFAPESFVGGPLTSGTYLPSNYGQYEFSFFDNATAFSDYFGITPNGTWTLYVDDVFPEDGGSLAGGWSLTFTTDAVAGVPEPAGWAMMIGGFGLAGAALRRRKLAVRYA